MADDKDRIVDEILSSLENQEDDGELPKKSWSMSEIDSLIGDDDLTGDDTDGSDLSLYEDYEDDFDEGPAFVGEYDIDASPLEKVPKQITLEDEAAAKEAAARDEGIAIGEEPDMFSETSGVFEEPEEAVPEESMPEEPAAEISVPEEPIVADSAAEESAAEPFAPKEPAVEEPAAEAFVPEAPAAEEPVQEEPVPEESAAEEPAAEEPMPEEYAAAEGPTPEEPYEDTPEYAPGPVAETDSGEPDSDYEADDEDEDDFPSKPSFRERFNAWKDRLVQIVEGGEEEDEFDEEDLVEPSESERPSRRRNRMSGINGAYDEGPEEPQNTAEADKPDRTAARKEENRAEPELYKGLDENPESPKMIMELADERSEMDREEKKALAQKTVGIHPFRNEHIEHQIIKAKVEKSEGVPTETLSGSEPTMVFGQASPDAPQPDVPQANVPQAGAASAEASGPDAPQENGEENPSELEKTRKIVNTAELEPLPTIIAADANLNTFDKAIVAKGGNKTIEHSENNELDGQIRLNGFDDGEQPPEQIDEDHAEEALREKRAEKVQDFKIRESFPGKDAAPEAKKESTPDREPARPDADNATLRELYEGDPRIGYNNFVGDYLKDEYKTEDDAPRIRNGLLKSSKRMLTALIVQGVGTIIGLILTGIIAAAGGNLEAIGGNASVCVLLNAILVIAVTAVGWPTVRKGISGFTEHKINASGAAVIVTVSCLVEDLVLAIVSQSTTANVGLFTAAACFAQLLPTVARYLALKRAIGNFEFLTGGTQISSTEMIDKEADSASIGRGMLLEDPVICYNAKVQRPAGFVENSFADDPADYYAERPALLVLGAALLYAVIFGIVRRSFVVGVGGFAAVCCIALPSFTLLASNISMFLDDRKFSRKGSVILGHRAVEESAYVNTYAMDATDIFPKGSCSIYGIKTFHNMRIDDAILYAAALVMESKGALSDVFENTILGKTDLLPVVETLAYEDHLGLSAWIHGRRILFGNRTLLVNHNVDIPDAQFEKQYTRGGRKVMYLAIAGKIAAMFVIEYHPDKHLRRCFRNMDRSGITLLVSNTDCNITEEMICGFYRLPITAVKVLGPVPGNLLRDYRNHTEEAPRSGILHNGTLRASMKTLYEARRLYDGVSINNVITAAYSIIGVILAVILAAVSAGDGLSSLTDGKIVLFQALWSVVAVGIPVLRSRNVK